jgi:hypothetical protein
MCTINGMTFHAPPCINIKALTWFQEIHKIKIITKKSLRRVNLFVINSEQYF